MAFEMRKLKICEECSKSILIHKLFVLEENYRSSGAILLCALEVIEQDIARPAKPLVPTHSLGTQPVLRKLPSSGYRSVLDCERNPKNKSDNRKYDKS